MKLRNYLVVFHDGQTTTVAAQRCYCADRFFWFVVEAEEGREAAVAAYASGDVRSAEVQNG